MTDTYVSYQSPSTIIAETVYHFLRGSIYGAAFGLVRQADGSYLHSFVLNSLLLIRPLTFT